MKILFFGLGSIGTRHARLLKEMGGHEIYAFRSGKNGEGNAFGIPEISNWKEVDRLKPEAAFITNPTHLHIQTALPCAERGMALFIEKPIDSTTKNLDRLIELVQRRKLPTYVAYVLRYHPAIKKLKEALRGRNIRRAQFVSRSYLPDWRPGQDHRESYSARRETGGGALLDVSHEFDLAQYLVGPIEDISGHLERRSNVTIDAEDFVEANTRCGSVRIEVLIDIGSRQKERTVTIETDQGTIAADLMQGTDRDTPYRDQLHYFLSHQNDPEMMNNLAEACPLFNKLIAFREKDLS